MNYILSLRYVKLFAYISAKWLQTARQESHKYRYNYYYGFQIIYGAANKAILLVLLGLLFQILPQVLIVTLTFAILRVWAGGLHFDSYTKCAYISLFSLIIMGLMAKHIQLDQITNITIFSLVFITFLIYAPVENKNRPLKGNEKIKFKVIAISLLFILFVLSILISSNPIVFGVLLAGLISLPVVNKLESLL